MISTIINKDNFKDLVRHIVNMNDLDQEIILEEEAKKNIKDLIDIITKKIMNIKKENMIIIIIE